MAYKDFDGLSAGPSTDNASNAQILQINGEIVELPDSSYIRDGNILRDGGDLVLESPQGSLIVEGYFDAVQAPTLAAPDGLSLTPELVESFAQSPLQYASNLSMNDESPIGAVNETTGEATVTRTDGSVETVQMGTEIYQGDVVETASDGAVNIVFTDDSSFAISEDARLAIDEYVFDPATEEGAQNFSVLKGLFVFTSGLVGRDDPDDVSIDTPTGSIGIRGTIIAGDVNEGEITVVEGAIVLRDFAGNEMTLAGQFETGKFGGGADGSISNLGQLSANDVSTRFSGVSKVAPTLFSSVNDVASENAADQNAPADSAPPSQDGNTHQGDSGDNGSPTQPEANANGSVDQNNDNQVDGTVNEEGNSGNGENLEETSAQDASGEGVKDPAADTAGEAAQNNATAPADPTSAPAIPQASATTSPTGISSLGNSKAAMQPASGGSQLKTLAKASGTAEGKTLAKHSAETRTETREKARAAGEEAREKSNDTDLIDSIEILLPPGDMLNDVSGDIEDGLNNIITPPTNVTPGSGGGLFNNAPVNIHDALDSGSMQYFEAPSAAPDAYFQMESHGTWDYHFSQAFMSGSSAIDYYNLSNATEGQLDTLIGNGNWTFTDATGHLSINGSYTFMSDSVFDIEIAAVDMQGNVTEHAYEMNLYDVNNTNPDILYTTGASNTTFAVTSTNVNSEIQVGAQDGSISPDGNTVFFNDHYAAIQHFSGNNNTYVFGNHAGGGAENLVHIHNYPGTNPINNTVIGGDMREHVLIDNPFNFFHGMGGDDVFTLLLTGNNDLDINLPTIDSSTGLIDGGTSGFNAGADIDSHYNINYGHNNQPGGFGDTLRIKDSAYVGIDFGMIDDSYIRGIERIDMDNINFDANVMISYQDIVNMTDNKNTLIFRGDVEDHVDFIGMDASNTKKVADDHYVQEADGPIKFDIYEVEGAQGKITLLIEQDAAGNNTSIMHGLESAIATH